MADDMAWPLAQVVDNLDTANVLFDFNPGRTSEQQMWLGANDFDYGTPEWDSSVLGLVEGGRTISLSFRAQGRNAESAISRLSEILTRTNPGYLMWQTRRDSAPLWFRLDRNTSANPLDFTTVWADDTDRSLWRWKVDLAADAFALGARQELTATTQLAQAGQPILPPLEITDPILGDAPAPLNLDLDAGDLTDYQTQLMSWAVDPNATVDPWAGAAVSDFSITGTDTGRLGTLPQTPPPGQFRALLYAKRTTTYNTSTFQVSADDGYGTALFSTPQVIVAPPAGVFDGRWIDCGRMNFPAGMEFADMAADSLEPLDFMVSINSTSSSGVWQILTFMLVPVQTVTSRAATTVLGVTFDRWPSGVNWPAGSPGVLRVEAERSRVGIVDRDSRNWLMCAPPVVDGAFPRVHPGARNFLFFLPRMNNVGVHDYGAPGETTMWYYPRHLHVGSR